MIPHTPTLTTDDVDEAWAKLLDYYGTLENNAMPMRIYDLVLKHTRRGAGGSWPAVAVRRKSRELVEETDP